MKKCRPPPPSPGGSTLAPWKYSLIKLKSIFYEDTVFYAKFGFYWPSGSKGDKRLRQRIHLDQ